VSPVLAVSRASCLRVLAVSGAAQLLNANLLLASRQSILIPEDRCCGARDTATTASSYIYPLFIYYMYLFF